LLSITKYYAMLNDQMTAERKIGNDVEGRSCGLISNDVIEFA